MKRENTLLLCIATLAVYILTGCKPDPSIEPEKEISSIPKNWPAPVYNFENNPVSDAGFELGKKLFFDPRLSRTNDVSCGTCHQPFSAFAQIEHSVSHGVEERLGTRNSPALFNLNWHSSFFWDGGVNHLEVQPINPIQNPVEMDETLENVIAKLRTDGDYKARFKNVFGSDTINSQRMLKALAQFMGKLVSSNSKYDKYVRREAGGTMNASELNGLQLFETHCSTCHKEPLFSDFSLRNNGLTPAMNNDSGRAHITREASDLYKFKVPSLRNLAYSSPYMHDGRFFTLDQVLDHYENGIEQSATLDPLLKEGIQLTAQERKDLKAFLNTLNDEEFVKDPRFQEPTD